MVTHTHLNKFCPINSCACPTRGATETPLPVERSEMSLLITVVQWPSYLLPLREVGSGIGELSFGVGDGTGDWVSLFGYATLSRSIDTVSGDPLMLRVKNLSAVLRILKGPL